MKPRSEELINKALGRNNLARTEQKEIGLMLRDKLAQCGRQATLIRELRDEVIRLKIGSKGSERD